MEEPTGLFLYTTENILFAWVSHKVIGTRYASFIWFHSEQSQ